MKHKIDDWQVLFECDHEQYWCGHGIAYTTWEHCATGVGSSLREALADCLEDLAEQDIDVTDTLKSEITAKLASQIMPPSDLDTDITVECDHDPEEDQPDCAICAGNWYYYVSINVTTVE